MNKLTPEQINEQIENLVQILNFLEIEESIQSEIKIRLIEDYMTGFHTLSRFEDDKYSTNKNESSLKNYDMPDYTTGVSYVSQAREFASKFISDIKELGEDSFNDFLHSMQQLPLDEKSLIIEKKNNQFEILEFFKNSITSVLEESFWLFGFKEVIRAIQDKNQKLIIANKKLKEMGLSNSKSIINKKSFIKYLAKRSGLKGKSSEKYFEKNYLLRRIINPVGLGKPIDLSDISLLLNEQEFEEYYYTKSSYYTQIFEKPEEDFINEFIKQIKFFIHAPEKFEEELDYSIFFLPYSSEKEKTYLVDTINLKQRLYKSIGFEKLFNSVHEKVIFLESKLLELKNNYRGIVTFTNELISSKYEDAFFNKVKVFSKENVEKLGLFNLKYFELIFPKHVDDFISEIRKNYLKLNGYDKTYYYNDVYLKVDNLSDSVVLNRVSDGIPVLSEIKLKDIFSNYENPLDSPNKNTFSYILNTYRLKILDVLIELKENENYIFVSEKTDSQTEIASFKYIDIDTNPGNINELFYDMRDKKLIDESVQLKSFKRLFNGEYSDTKIIWAGTTEELSFFIKELHNSQKKVESVGNKHWLITVNYFVNEDGEQFKRNQLSSQQKPASSEMIKKLVEYL